jgi:hypothetical protein
VQRLAIVLDMALTYQSWWSWDFPLSTFPLCFDSLSSQATFRADAPAGLAVSFARLATWFPSRAFGVIMIMMVLFMAIM